MTIIVVSNNHVHHVGNLDMKEALLVAIDLFLKTRQTCSITEWTDKHVEILLQRVSSKSNEKI